MYSGVLLSYVVSDIVLLCVTSEVILRRVVSDEILTCADIDIYSDL